MAEKLANENVLRDGFDNELRVHARRFGELFALK